MIEIAICFQYITQISVVIVQAGKKPEQIVHGKDFGRALSAETIDTLLPLFLAQVMMTMMMMVMMMVMMLVVVVVMLTILYNLLPLYLAF